MIIPCYGRPRCWLVFLVAATAYGCAGSTPDAPLAPGPENRVMQGYSAQDPRDVTGSVSSLSEADLEDVRVVQVGELLWGRVPGLDVTRRSDGRFSLRIRGANSFLGSDEPLVVVDGVALVAGRDLWSINPRDIARIDVLKDGSSAAIYGSRGANGVIVITTKRPGRR